ncbi:MAG: STAS domain-containing protein [Phycisphaerae bacterium]|nr:STAS domain-containing protein [Phycisphaerae bacterium]
MSASDPPRNGAPLQIDVERREHASVVRICGAATMDVSSEIGRRLVEVAVAKPHCIVVDLSALEFIDSNGLGGLVAAYLKQRRQGGSLVLVGPTAAIHDVLDVTRLNQLLSIYPDLSAALAATRGA